jgi:predicted enzyme related to lactoylglutathione lyase
MDQNIKFVHTNLIAKDWRNLAEFYINVFGCVPKLPERDLSGPWVDHLTRMEHAHIRGIHLVLPGYDEHGPSLEIFGYDVPGEQGVLPMVNSSGFRHIAFHVENMEETRSMIIAHGGQAYGEMVKPDIPGVGILTVVYMRDPEGNILELQKWL